MKICPNCNRKHDDSVEDCDCGNELNSVFPQIINSKPSTIDSSDHNEKRSYGKTIMLITLVALAATILIIAVSDYFSVGRERQMQLIVILLPLFCFIFIAFKRQSHSNKFQPSKIKNISQNENATLSAFVESESSSPCNASNINDKTSETTANMSLEEKECPFCAEIIKKKAKLCKFCKRTLEV